MPADVQVFVTPTYILRATPWTDGPLTYDAPNRILTFHRSRTSPLTMQFAIPVDLEGYTTSVVVTHAPRGSEAVAHENGNLLLPPLAMDGEYTADITFDPTPQARPPLLTRQTVPITVRLRPLAES